LKGNYMEKQTSFRPPVFYPLMIIGGIVAFAAIALLLGFVVQLLWNWLLPGLFGIPKIDYWQAWGLLVLCHILFKSGASHHGMHRGLHGRHDENNCNDKNWHDNLKERIKRAHDVHSGKANKEEGSSKDEEEPDPKTK
jgi:hypothetical protein